MLYFARRIYVPPKILSVFLVFDSGGVLRWVLIYFLSSTVKIYQQERGGAQPILPELMAEEQVSIDSAFYGYPLPKKGPETGYATKPASNPIIRGITLSGAGWAYVSYHFMLNSQMY